MDREFEREVARHRIKVAQEQQERAQEQQRLERLKITARPILLRVLAAAEKEFPTVRQAAADYADTVPLHQLFGNKVRRLIMDRAFHMLSTVCFRLWEEERSKLGEQEARDLYTLLYTYFHFVDETRTFHERFQNIVRDDLEELFQTRLATWKQRKAAREQRRRNRPK